MIASKAKAGMNFNSGQRLIPPQAVSPYIDLTYGQSNITNSYPQLGDYLTKMLQQSVYGLHTWAVPGTATPGPLGPSGILTAEWRRIDGITPYRTTDAISVGRAAAFVEQMLRINKGLALRPILEACHGYPGCTWQICSKPKGMGLHSGWTVPYIGNPGTPWQCLEIGIRKIAALTSRGILNNPFWRSVCYEQGGSVPDTAKRKDQDLDDMFTSYDDEAVFPAGFPIFFVHQAGLSNDTNLVSKPSGFEVINYCRRNTNGRSWFVTSIYQWPFDGLSNVHTDKRGTFRVGEMVGYARYVFYTERLNAYRPLWLSLTTPTSISGQNITVHLDRPSGRDFASGVISYQNSYNDGIKDWPKWGFHVRRNDIELTVTPTIIGPLTLNLAITETLHSGDQLEHSYALRGPGGTNPGNFGGCGGNITMIGPISPVFFADSPPGNTINAWLTPYVETITV
jgi:hypothetical protein